MKRLVLFGDSLIALFSKDEVIMLEEKTGCDVYNCAISGWNTNNGVERAEYIARLKPDIVVMSFGTNDCAHWKKVELPNFITNIDKILSYFKESKIVFLLPPPTIEEKQPPEKRRSNETVREYAEAIKALLDKEHVEYVDSWKVFKDLYDNGKNYHEEDGIHFNEFGYQTVINEIAGQLK